MESWLGQLAWRDFGTDTLEGEKYGELAGGQAMKLEQSSPKGEREKRSMHLQEGVSDWQS